MSVLVARPSEIIRKFRECYAVSPEAATEYFYKFSQDTDYIRRYRVCKDQKWVTPTPYGDLDITINLSKPERIPRRLRPPRTPNRAAIPNASCVWKTKAMPDVNHPAKTEPQDYPITINGGQWGFSIPFMYITMNIVSFLTPNISL